MLISGGRLKRGLLCIGLASVALAVVSVASASAAITTTSITSPTSPFVYTFNDNATPTPTVEITGTTDSTAPGTDTIDINCYYTQAANGINHTNIANNISLAGDGSFDWTGSVSEESTCTLRAVPHNYGDTYPLTQFSGPFSVLNFTRQDEVSGGSHQTGPFDDFFYSASSTNAYDDYESVGSCGLDFAEPIMFNGNFADAGSWNCAAALFGDDGSGTRSEIKIGNDNAYDSQSAASAFPGADTQTGFQPLSSSYTSSASPSNPGGNVSINESENLVSCPGGVHAASNGSNCASWNSTGVSFARSISQTNGGQVVTITDTYTSTDHASHNLDLEYDNYSDEDGDAAWRLPGSSQYEFYSPGDQATLPNASNNVIYTNDGYYNDGGFDAPGALIYNTQPNLAKWIASCCSGTSQEMLLDYQRTVPAGGSMSITQTYMVAPNQASLDKMVNAVLDSVNKPTVSITSPANNTVTSASSVQVSGKASANEGLTLKVNGAAVPVNSDGTWSTSVSLNNGKNTIKAVASDGSGNTAQATDTVYYNLKGAFCIVPNVSHMKLAKSKRALKAAGCKVGKVHKVSSSVKKGHVIHASHSAHVVLAHGTKVGLTVSKGKSHKKHTVRVHAPGVFGVRPRH
jgi:hypothetical protein